MYVCVCVCVCVCVHLCFICTVSAPGSPERRRDNVHYYYLKKNYYYYYYSGRRVFVMITMHALRIDLSHTARDLGLFGEVNRRAITDS